MLVRCSLRTDTATIAVFDPAALRHRVSDDADWWSVPEHALAEINAGNVLFVDVGQDGFYDVSIFRGSPSETHRDHQVQAVLRCASGRFFVSAGEQVQAAGKPEPNLGEGGVFLDFPSTHCLVSIRHETPFTLEVELVEAGRPATNSFVTLPAIDWPDSRNTLPAVELPSRTVAVDAGGWSRCPACNRRFKTTDKHAFANGRHVRCGQLLEFQ